MKSKILPLILTLPQPAIESECIVYHPVQAKTEALADAYAETDQLSHRYLAYRDIPSLIKQYVKGDQTLDYGTGTGISAAFLHNLGLDVIGVDIDFLMLDKARENFPNIQFFDLEKFMPSMEFDLIFSSFVLFDMKTKKDIIDYLDKAVSLMKKKGIIIAITGSEDLYSVLRKWTAYDSNFDENRELRSGDITRLRLRHPAIEFRDYFWKQTDYMDCFKKANLKVLKVHRPLGSKDDPFLWEDEKFFSPFTVYILEKK